MTIYDSLFDITTTAEVTSSETNMSAVIINHSIRPATDIKELFKLVFDMATEQEDTIPLPEVYFDRLGEIQDQLDTDSRLSEDDRTFIIGLYMILTV